MGANLYSPTFVSRLQSFANVCSPRLTIGAAVRIAGNWTRSAGPKHIQAYELQANKVDILGPSDASVCSLYHTT